jgi:hypothetical protein
MARPTKYSAELAEALCAWIRKGTSYVDACSIEGVSYNSLNGWRKEHPEFDVDIKRAEAMCKQDKIDIIFKASEETWQAAAWWLERKHRNEYALRREITGADGESFIPDHMAEAMKRAGKFANPPKPSKKK